MLYIEVLKRLKKDYNESMEIPNKELYDLIELIEVQKSQIKSLQTAAAASIIGLFIAAIHIVTSQ